MTPAANNLYLIAINDDAANARAEDMAVIHSETLQASHALQIIEFVYLKYLREFGIEAAACTTLDILEATYAAVEHWLGQVAETEKLESAS